MVGVSGLVQELGSSTPHTTFFCFFFKLRGSNRSEPDAVDQALEPGIDFAEKVVGELGPLLCRRRRRVSIDTGVAGGDHIRVCLFAGQIPV